MSVLGDPVHQFEPVLYAQFLVDVVDMVPDGARRNEKLLLDVLVVSAECVLYRLSWSIVKFTVST